MSYMALYRRWRPKTFDEVKGQDAICETLKNQIKLNRFGHAYLFCGTRGTGKTSIAKILARAVNCEHIKDGNPCNECKSCISSLKESSMNIVEMDAASNRKIDDIRDIIEKIQYPPTEGRYRVFIIDEVHMLTTEAFNALLKTLEEPPSYVIFILATTDIQKVPKTILSRCQRYDFKRIDASTISKHLQELTKAEHIDIENRAIDYIARSADGAMRDALSLLDECIAYKPDEKVTYDTVLKMLGTADTEVFADMIDAMISYDTVRVLNIFNKMMDEGREAIQFISDLMWYMRDILVLKTSSDAISLIDASDDSIQVMQRQADKIKTETLIRYIEILSSLDNRLRYSMQKKILTELTLIRLLSPEMDIDNDAILSRIAKIEDRLSSGEYIEQKTTKTNQKDTKEAEDIDKETIVKLPDAIYEDYEKLKSDWNNILEKLDRPDRAKLKLASIEPSRDGKMILIFDNDYDIDNYLDEIISRLSDAATELNGKIYTFDTKVRKNNDKIKKYVKQSDFEDSIKGIKVKIVDGGI